MVLTAIIILATAIACCVGFAKGLKEKGEDASAEGQIADTPKPKGNHSTGGGHKEATEDVAEDRARDPRTGRYIKKEETK